MAGGREPAHRSRRRLIWVMGATPGGDYARPMQPAPSANPVLPAVPAPADGQRTLDACFLGPYGENDSLLERPVVECLRDHVHWGCNFHADDPPATPKRAARSVERRVGKGVVA